MSETEYLHALPADYELDRYRIIRVLGIGGFGVTYLASHEVLGNRVAIKEYLPNDFAVRQGTTVSPKSKDDEDDFQWGLTRFIDEARTVVKFNHPNIVRVHSFFEGNSTAYMVMDYEEGESLDDLLARKSKLKEEELKDILLPIIDGLSTVHQDGVLHRDIKPSNIFVRNSDGSPVLLDFGSARHAISKKSMSMTAITSPGYSPPEQYETDSEAQGSWSDIYSLAALSYRAITGNKPDDALARERRILRDQSDPLVPLSESKEAKKYDPQFIAAIEHGLKVNERERPQDLGAWQDEMNVERTTVDTTGRSRPQARQRASESSIFNQVKTKLEQLVRNISEQSIVYYNEYKRFILPGVSIVGIVLVLSVISVLLINWVDTSHEGPSADEIAEESEASADPAVAENTLDEILDDELIGAEEEIDFGESLVSELDSEIALEETLEEEEEVVPASGALVLNLTPANARVTIFDIPDRYQPGGIELPVGTYRVRVMAEGYLTTYRNIEVSEESGPVNIALEVDPNPKIPFAVSVRPEHAIVTIADSDGNLIEHTPGSMLQAGEYRIEASADGFRTGIVQVEHSEIKQIHEISLIVKWQFAGEFKECERCPDMVIVSGGKYQMGSPWRSRNRDASVNVNETPQREVEISSVAVARYETTFDQWEACVEAGGCNGHVPEAKWGRGSMPVMNVNWNDAQAYVDWLSRKSETKYRLPSEAEWEYLARAGTATNYWLGDRVDPSGANYNGHEGGTTAVSNYAANAFGLFNMHGNVGEWIADCWYRTYAGDIEQARERNPFRPKVSAPLTGVSWEKSNCTRRVVRGGSWKSAELEIDSRFRDSQIPSVREDDLGFRVVTSQFDQAVQ